MPVLVLIGSESVVGDRLLKGVLQVAENVQSDVIEQSGHWLAEEQPVMLSEKLLTFFSKAD